jgi:hypothetical protein
MHTAPLLRRKHSGNTAVWLATALFAAGGTPAQEATIVIHADQTLHRVSRHLTGACIEDVNHEIYGGLYSQMIFGESFQEPTPATPPKGFQAFGGTWRVNVAGELTAGGGEGPKLVSEHTPFAAGEAGVEVFLADRSGGNAGLIVKVDSPGAGADNFVGYEVSLDAAAQMLRLGRHRHNWEHIKDTPCTVPAGQWIPLVVKLTERTIEVQVSGRSVIQYEDREHPLRSGSVGLRPWQREARFRNLWVKVGNQTASLPFQRSAGAEADVSGMWRPVKRGSASGQWTLESSRPFAGGQSQRIAFMGGIGEVGVENQGLNRWGMHFEAGKLYEGCLWVRAEKPADLHLALESRDGEKTQAETRLAVTSNAWQRLEFTLTPGATEKAGRFAIKLKSPGSVVLGHAFLQPGEWGRFKGLPVRRDVAEGLVDQGITVLRYGGSMVNHAEYRWKSMIGPRDQRSPHRGTWYPHSSNGWGILDFLDFCEAAGFLAIPAFNMGESPQDMADFMEYVNGPADSEWGRKRVADGHPAPYNLRHVELGNEERVDDAYFQKFKPQAEALWAKDPNVTIVVGDFVYGEPISDPFKFKGAASGITSLAGQQKILQLAKAHDREVWFDLHVGTDGPRPDSTFAGMFAFLEALGKIADGARHKIVVFEFNAGNHSQRRALANALAINAIERDGRIPIATSANCLQPDGQNDNGWDQGLLFLNPSQVWLQPPGYVTRMVSANYQPKLLRAEAQSPGSQIDVSAKRSDDGKTVVLQVVNLNDQATPATIRLNSFAPSKRTVSVEDIAGTLNARNTAEAPNRIALRRTEWRPDWADGTARYTFAPLSFTVLRLE